MFAHRCEPKIDKDTIRSAVCAASHFRWTIPFNTIHEAKALIAQCCEANAFDYHLPSDTPESVRRNIADRVHFFVALNAYKRGEFAIAKPFANPQKLREAIEGDVARVLQLIPPGAWSRKFPSVRLATDWMAKQCAEVRFVYTPFSAVDTAKLHGYVHYNAIRQAYEAGKVTLASVPKDWFKRMDLKPAASMHETIDADVDRLMPLLPPWPVLSSINAVRNHVSQFAARTRFQYTGWGKVEPARYRLWVNYHTAKRAFDAGCIAMGPWAPLDETRLIEASPKMEQGHGQKKQVRVVQDDFLDDVDMYDDLMDFSDDLWFLKDECPESPSRKGSSTPTRRASSTPRRGSAASFKTLTD